MQRATTTHPACPLAISRLVYEADELLGRLELLEQGVPDLVGPSHDHQAHVPDRLLYWITSHHTVSFAPSADIHDTGLSSQYS